MIGSTSAVLRDDITSLRSKLAATSITLDDLIDVNIAAIATNQAAITSVQAMIGNTSAALRDDVTSLRARLGATSAALDTLTDVNQAAITSVQAMIGNTSAALKDDITSVITKHTSVANVVANSVARLDANNDLQGFHFTNYITNVQTTTGPMTLTSIDGGITWVMKPTTSINITLNKALPLGWNASFIELGIGKTHFIAPASCSLVNASTHSALNNYGSGAGLMVINQEGANSHAWYWLQGETE